MEEIVYLIQAPDYIPDHVQMIEDIGREVYILSWKKPVKHKNNIFFPDSTWTEGRNKLAEIVPKKYLYYVFLDDDVDLNIQIKNYPEDANKNPWKIFENFLLEHKPAIGSCFCFYPVLKGNLVPKYLDDAMDIMTVKEHEPILSAVHKDAMKLCFPIYTGFDKISIYWASGIYTRNIILAFKSCILQCNKIVLKNTDRLRHTGKYLLYPGKFFHELYKSSFLKETDKDIITLMSSPSWLYSPDKEYKRPYPYKYKEMVEDFKTRVNKKHILWRNHPFINE